MKRDFGCDVCLRQSGSRCSHDPNSHRPMIRTTVSVGSTPRPRGGWAVRSCSAVGTGTCASFSIIGGAWRENEHWHVNVLEALAGLVLLVAGNIVAPAPFVSEFGNNNVANANARRNATPNLQISEILRHRAEFVSKENITTRQLRVSTEDNVLGDPLSRGARYMKKFREEARKMGAKSFVRMDVPPLIVPMLPVLAELHPGVLREEYESQMDL